MLEKIKLLLASKPGLKIRDIAEKLSIEKKDVNSLLCKNPQFFYQNKDYEWRLLSNECSVIFEDKWVDCLSFENTLITSGVNINTNQSVTFIFQKETKLLLESIARLLAICNQAVTLRKSVIIDLTINTTSLHYFNRTGFFDHLHHDVTVMPQRPKTSTATSKKGASKNLVEFGAVDPANSNRELVNQLADSFIKLSNKKYEDSIFTIFSELITNIKDHSETNLHGFAALQIYSGKNTHIQTVISDSGLGIAATLRPHLMKYYPQFQSLSDLELVKAVMSEGQISKYGTKSGHGMGFKSSREKALKFNAKYSVRQSDFGLDFQFKNGKLLPVTEHTGLVKILGTHICFDFDIDDSESTD